LKLSVIIYNGYYGHDTKITPQERATKLVLVATENYSAYGNDVPVHHTTKMDGSYTSTNAEFWHLLKMRSFISKVTTEKQKPCPCPETNPGRFLPATSLY
jgi:hypothetical protein